MESTLKNKKLAPTTIIIDFFALLYDLVYDFIKLLLKNSIKLILKIKKLAPMNILIDFFSFQYDLGFHFFKFLVEYVKWITDTQSPKSPGFVTHADELTAMARI